MGEMHAEQDSESVACQLQDSSPKNRLISSANCSLNTSNGHLPARSYTHCEFLATISCTDCGVIFLRAVERPLSFAKLKIWLASFLLVRGSAPGHNTFTHWRTATARSWACCATFLNPSSEFLWVLTSGIRPSARVRRSKLWRRETLESASSDPSFFAASRAHNDERKSAWVWFQRVNAILPNQYCYCRLRM